MRKTIFLAALCLGAMEVFAQEANTSSEEEIRKKEEINEIKLGEKAVYAEVIELATDDNEAISLAQQKSINLLQAHVIEVFAKRMHMEKEDVQEIWDVIDDKCQNIVIKKGDLFRVFSYIMKDAIGLSRSKPKKGDVEKYLLPDSTEVTLNDTAVLKSEMHQLAHVMTGGKDSIDNVSQPAPVVADTVAVASTLNPQPVPDKKIVPDSVPEKTIVVEQKEAKPAIAVPEKEVVEERKEVAPAIEVPEFIRPVVEKENFKELMRYLAREKNRTLMYGNKNDMQNFEKCYVAVFDKSTRKVVAVLGKGSDERVNYKTLKNDNLANYRDGNYSAIFIQEY